jgi:hypothetical protein
MVLDTFIKPTMEVRWFCRQRPFDPLAVFGAAFRPECRTDWYARIDGIRTGIKLRDGRLEAKLRMETLGERVFGSVVGQVERWTKWSGIVSQSHGPSDEVLRNAGWVAVEKRRYLQCFELDSSPPRLVPQPSPNGCDFELTEIRVCGETWWTVGFESTGPESAIFDNLQRTVADSLNRVQLRDADLLGRSCGYPEWLTDVP